MTDYDTTWVGNRNGLSKQALDKIEENASLMWMSGANHPVIKGQVGGVDLEIVGTHQSVSSPVARYKYGLKTGGVDQHFFLSDNNLAMEGNVSYLIAFQVDSLPGETQHIFNVVESGGTGNMYAGLSINSSDELVYDDDGDASGFVVGTVPSTGLYIAWIVCDLKAGSVRDITVNLIDSTGTTILDSTETGRGQPALDNTGELYIGNRWSTNSPLDGSLLEYRQWSGVFAAFQMDEFSDPTDATTYFETLEGSEDFAWWFWDLERQSSSPENSTWGERVGSSDYTGNGNSRTEESWVQNLDKPRLVVVSVEHDNPLQLGGNSSIAVAELSSDGVNVDYEVGRTRKDTGSGLTRERRFPLCFVVLPNEYYRIRDASTGNAGIDAHVGDGLWYEYDFDYIYSAQEYTHATEKPLLRKLNYYAEGVSDTVRAESLSSAVARSTTFGTWIDTSNSIGVLMNLICRVGSSATTGDVSIEQRDSGEAGVEIGRMSTNNSLQAQVRSFPLVINPNGGCRIVENSGNNDWEDAFENEFDLPVAIAFTSGESGSATETKWKDLDTNASLGVNYTKVTRNEDVGGGPRTPSSTNWTIVVCHCSINSRGDSSSGGETHVDSVKRAEVFVGASTDSTLEHGTMMAVVPPGSSWEFVSNGVNVTLLKATEWVVGS